MSRHDIQLWAWSLDDEPPGGETLLTDEERDRAQRFVGPLLQRRFVAARAQLRALLGHHLGRDPRSLVFLLNEFGKPRLADHPGVHFSLSHSQDRALLAVSDGPEIGADLEMMRAVDHLDLARRYFHPDEVGAIERHRDPRQAFFRIWTLKEAGGALRTIPGGPGSEVVAPIAPTSEPAPTEPAPAAPAPAP